MTLELVQARLTTMAPVLDLLRTLFKADLIAMHPETWYGLLRHFGLDETAELPAMIRLRQDLPPGQALMIPLTQFVTLELVA